MTPQEEVVALVILQSPAGPPPDSALTAARLAAELPDAEAVAAVQAELSGAGFTVHPALGISFSIEGRVADFQRYFGVSPHQDAQGLWSVEGGMALPLDGIPERARELIREVVFESPMEPM